MRMDGRYSSQKVPDEVGFAINWHHNFHHDTHPAQAQDWCIGVRTHDSGIGLETICSHEVEDDDNITNEWGVI